MIIEEMGFTGILMEAGFPNSLYINDYITNGIGTATSAHQKLGTWRYQEMRNLIDWMRTYNIQCSVEGKDPPDNLFVFPVVKIKMISPDEIVPGQATKSILTSSYK